MNTDPADSEAVAPPSVRDHLANERTLLAWIRTALTVMGLGFVVDRLAADGEPGRMQTIAGVGLVLIGGAVALGGAYSYLKSRREMATGRFRPAVGLHLTFVAVVVLGAIVVAAVLLSS